jgi:RNA polymerase sigma-70 factor (ECF subfamily)
MGTEQNDEQDRQDMIRLAGGNDAALNDLMERHAQRLFHYLVRQLQDENEAEDIAQETFARIYQHRLRFDRRHRFSTWLYAIATNLARDRQRWLARHPQVSLDAGQPTTGASLGDVLPANQAAPSDRVDADDRVRAVRRAVASLPDELRTALVLAEYEECPYQDIAAILKCSPKAVEMRLYRARQKLREQLRAFLPGEG